MNSAIQELAKAASQCNGESDEMTRLDEQMFGNRRRLYSTDQVERMLNEVMALAYQQGWNTDEITPVETKIQELLS